MKINYRPEIDGLRAIAVIGVIFYHSEILIKDSYIFYGGFLGVDIFFLISGYLITSLILKELKEKKNFSYYNFYKRRARRLIPALILVLIVTSFFAYKFLLPVQFKQYIYSLLSSIFFGSNFFFHYTAQAYGAEILSAKPLLHTWSLGIEEQFYILFPVFFVFFYKRINTKITYLFIIGIIISIIFSSWASKIHTSFNFYMLSSRGWEFLVGGLIATSELKYHKIKHNFLNNLFPKIGFLMIILSFLLFKEVNHHPSYLTLIPILGCFLVIRYSYKDEAVTKILSNKILTNIGLISYSLYLWHHPILSFGKMSGFTNDSLFIKLILVILSFLMAFLSFYFVEKPFRNIKKYSFIKFSYVLSVITIFLVSTLFLTIEKQKKTFPSLISNVGQQTWFTTRGLIKPCFQRKKFFCSFNNIENFEPVFLIGDSVLASLQEGLKDELLKRDFNFIPMTNGGCDFVTIIENEKNLLCNSKINFERKKQVFLKKESILILHLNYKKKFYLKNKNVIKEFRKEIKNLLRANYKIILIYPIPQMNVHVSSEIRKVFKKEKNNIENFYSNKNNLIKISLSNYLEDSKYIFNIFNEMKHKNLYKMYPHKFLCNRFVKNQCVGHNKKEIYYIDTAHLSQKGAKLINAELINIIDNID